MSGDADEPNAALKAELECIKQEIPTFESVRLIAAVPALVKAEIKKTEHKQVAVTCLFQPCYPEVPLVTEIKSKTLPDKILNGLAKVCDDEARKLKGTPQVIHIIQFVKAFIWDNPLCICSEEISSIKRLLTAERDEIKLKQKNSQVIVKIFQDQYFVQLRISIPDDYPLHQAIPEITHHNFPEFLLVHFQAQVVEIARQCVEPPLKKKPKDPPFLPKGSFQPVCEYIIKHVKKYPLETCPLCHDKVLPADPSNEIAYKGGNRLERVYCGHIFHFPCLNKYMKTPPFTGKKCPTCCKQIFHEKWKVSEDVMEKRWAHKQAKQRELEEVVDFLE